MKIYDNGLYVVTHACNSVDAHYKFSRTKIKYEIETGLNHRSPILAYSVRQSFAPGEITPEKALEIGREMAMIMTDGEYAFIVATHIDPFLHTTFLSAR